MNTCLRLTDFHHREIRDYLFPGDGKEAIVLCLCGRREGRERRVLTVREVVPVPYSECSVRTPDQVVWSTAVLDRLMARIWKSGMSVVKIHSHPGGYDRFSRTDDESDRMLSVSFDGLFGEGRLHGSAVMLPDGSIFGRELIGGEIGSAFASVLVPGDDIRMWGRRNIETLGEDDLRNGQAFGAGTIAILRHLRVAIIGCSGTGSVVIEQLARLGVGEFVLIDPDVVEKKNLNRIINSSAADADQKMPKVLVAKRAIEALGRVGEGTPWLAALTCPCGCGDVIHLSLLKRDSPRWSLHEESDGTMTLSPSVWRSRGCGSHFFIKKSSVIWCYREQARALHLKKRR